MELRLKTQPSSTRVKESYKDLLSLRCTGDRAILISSKGEGQVVNGAESHRLKYPDKTPSVPYILSASPNGSQVIASVSSGELLVLDMDKNTVNHLPPVPWHVDPQPQKGRGLGNLGRSLLRGGTPSPTDLDISAAFVSDEANGPVLVHHKSSNELWVWRSDLAESWTLLAEKDTSNGVLTACFFSNPLSGTVLAHATRLKQRDSNMISISNTYFYAASGSGMDESVMYPANAKLGGELKLHHNSCSIQGTSSEIVAQWSPHGDILAVALINGVNSRLFFYSPLHGKGKEVDFSASLHDGLGQLTSLCWSEDGLLLAGVLANGYIVMWSRLGGILWLSNSSKLYRIADLKGPTTFDTKKSILVAYDGTKLIKVSCPLTYNDAISCMIGTDSTNCHDGACMDDPFYAWNLALSRPVVVHDTEWTETWQMLHEAIKKKIKGQKGGESVVELLKKYVSSLYWDRLLMCRDHAAKLGLNIFVDLHVRMPTTPSAPLREAYLIRMANVLTVTESACNAQYARARRIGETRFTEPRRRIAELGVAALTDIDDEMRDGQTDELVHRRAAIVELCDGVFSNARAQSQPLKRGHQLFVEGKIDEALRAYSIAGADGVVASVRACLVSINLERALTIADAQITATPTSTEPGPQYIVTGNKEAVLVLAKFMASYFRGVDGHIGVESPHGQRVVPVAASTVAEVAVRIAEQWSARRAVEYFLACECPVEAVHICRDLGDWQTAFLLAVDNQVEDEGTEVVMAQLDKALRDDEFSEVLGVMALVTDSEYRDPNRLRKEGINFYLNEIRSCLSGVSLRVPSEYADLPGWQVIQDSLEGGGVSLTHTAEPEEQAENLMETFRKTRTQHDLNMSSDLITRLTATDPMSPNIQSSPGSQQFDDSGENIMRSRLKEAVNRALVLLKTQLPACVTEYSTALSSSNMTPTSPPRLAPSFRSLCRLIWFAYCRDTIAHQLATGSTKLEALHTALELRHFNDIKSSLEIQGFIINLAAEIVEEDPDIRPGVVTALSDSLPIKVVATQLMSKYKRIVTSPAARTAVSTTLGVWRIDMDGDDDYGFEFFRLYKAFYTEFIAGVLANGNYDIRSRFAGMIDTYSSARASIHAVRRSLAGYSNVASKKLGILPGEQEEEEEWWSEDEESDSEAEDNVDVQPQNKRLTQLMVGSSESPKLQLQLHSPSRRATLLDLRGASVASPTGNGSFNFPSPTSPHRSHQRNYSRTSSRGHDRINNDIVNPSGLRFGDDGVGDDVEMVEEEEEEEVLNTSGSRTTMTRWRSVPTGPVTPGLMGSSGGLLEQLEQRSDKSDAEVLEDPLVEEKEEEIEEPARQHSTVVLVQSISGRFARDEEEEVELVEVEPVVDVEEPVEERVEEQRDESPLEDIPMLDTITDELPPVSDGELNIEKDESSEESTPIDTKKEELPAVSERPIVLEDLREEEEDSYSEEWEESEEETEEEYIPPQPQYLYPQMSMPIPPMMPWGHSTIHQPLAQGYYDTARVQRKSSKFVPMKLLRLPEDARKRPYNMPNAHVDVSAQSIQPTPSVATTRSTDRRGIKLLEIKPAAPVKVIDSTVTSTGIQHETISLGSSRLPPIAPRPGRRMRLLTLKPKTDMKPPYNAVKPLPTIPGQTTLDEYFKKKDEQPKQRIQEKVRKEDNNTEKKALIDAIANRRAYPATAQGHTDKDQWFYDVYVPPTRPQQDDKMEIVEPETNPVEMLHVLNIGGDGEYIHEVEEENVEEEEKVLEKEEEPVISQEDQQDVDAEKQMRQNIIDNIAELARLGPTYGWGEDSPKKQEPEQEPTPLASPVPSAHETPEQPSLRASLEEPRQVHPVPTPLRSSIVAQRRSLDEPLTPAVVITARETAQWGEEVAARAEKELNDARYVLDQPQLEPEPIPARQPVYTDTLVQRFDQLQNQWGATPKQVPVPRIHRPPLSSSVENLLLRAEQTLKRHPDTVRTTPGSKIPGPTPPSSSSGMTNVEERRREKIRQLRQRVNTVRTNRSEKQPPASQLPRSSPVESNDPVEKLRKLRSRASKAGVPISVTGRSPPPRKVQEKASKKQSKQSRATTADDRYKHAKKAVVRIFAQKNNNVQEVAKRKSEQERKKKLAEIDRNIEYRIQDAQELLGDLALQIPLSPPAEHQDEHHVTTRGKGTYIGSRYAEATPEGKLYIRGLLDVRPDKLRESLGLSPVRKSPQAISPYSPSSDRARAEEELANVYSSALRHVDDSLLARVSLDSAAVNESDVDWEQVNAIMAEDD